MPKPHGDTTEVVATPENDRRQRRHWSKDEKLRIIRAADACTKRGELGALLRREGLYSSLLHGWRERFRAEGEVGLANKPAGRKPKDQRERDLEALRRKLAKTERELRVANAVIELQKKAHELLEMTSLDDLEPTSEASSLNSSASATGRSR